MLLDDDAVVTKLPKPSNIAHMLSIRSTVRFFLLPFCAGATVVMIAPLRLGAVPVYESSFPAQTAPIPETAALAALESDAVDGYAMPSGSGRLLAAALDTSPEEWEEEGDDAAEYDEGAEPGDSGEIASPDYQEGVEPGDSGEASPPDMEEPPQQGGYDQTSPSDAGMIPDQGNPDEDPSSGFEDGQEPGDWEE
ncbi:MAG: hypothetical protein HGA77_11440 [Chlorobiaceae bacterium]|nr:hypothetical protein [Chlorobiaceae bacterium]